MRRAQAGTVEDFSSALGRAGLLVSYGSCATPTVAHRVTPFDGQRHTAGSLM